jgi:hypothetical protein
VEKYKGIKVQGIKKHQNSDVLYDKPLSLWVDQSDAQFNVLDLGKLFYHDHNLFNKYF